MSSYYELNRQERLMYQKQYNNSEYYKAYQSDYFQKNKEVLNQRRKEKYHRSRVTQEQPSLIPLPQYKLRLLEVMLREKLKRMKLMKKTYKLFPVSSFIMTF